MSFILVRKMSCRSRSKVQQLEVNLLCEKSLGQLYKISRVCFPVFICVINYFFMRFLPNYIKNKTEPTAFFKHLPTVQFTHLSYNTRRSTQIQQLQQQSSKTF